MYIHKYIYMALFYENILHLYIIMFFNKYKYNRLIYLYDIIYENILHFFTLYNVYKKGK